MNKIIVVGSKGRNMVSVAPGANYALTPSDFDYAVEKLKEADVVIMQLEIPWQKIRGYRR
ncbi:MAG: hypothetical protein GWP06_18165 [Actinobacteria bacterium]|nr:hypothetical protein [Actinomycetota bacterium]